MSLDIFSPTLSVVPKGLEGKTILLYGSNSVGKTLNATKLSKPFYLGFEKGLNAISGIPFNYITKWSDFKKLNKQFTGKWYWYADTTPGQPAYFPVHTAEISAKWWQGL